MRLMSYEVCRIPLPYSHHYEYNENWLTKLHPLGKVTIKGEKKKEGITKQPPPTATTIIMFFVLAGLHEEHGWICCFGNSVIELLDKVCCRCQPAIWERTQLYYSYRLARQQLDLKPWLFSSSWCSPMAQGFRRISGCEKTNMKGQFNFTLIKHLDKCLHNTRCNEKHIFTSQSVSIRPH